MAFNNNNNGVNNSVSNEGLFDVIRAMGEQIDRLYEDALRKDELWQARSALEEKTHEQEVYMLKARFALEKRIHKEEVSELKARLQEVTNNKAKGKGKASSSAPSLKSNKGAADERVFTPLLGMTQTEAFEILTASGKLWPFEDYKPKKRNPEFSKWCKYHICNGHTTEKCTPSELPSKT